MKKLVSVLLCLVLMASASVALMESERAMEGNMYLEGLPIVKEPVVYEILGNIQNQEIDPETVSHTLALNEKTGVSFKWTVVNNAERAERLATVMASGDLPDVFINVLTDSDRLIYGEAGALLNIKDYEQYAPRFFDAMAKEDGAKAKVELPDGSIYSIPQFNFYSVWPGNGAYINYEAFINSDWLEAVGMDAPTTIEEFKDVLIAFRDKDPNGNGAQDEIPLSFMYDGGNNKIAVLLTGPFGFVGNATNLNVKDGAVYYAIQDENYKAAIEWQADLYEENLIDPEAFTMDQSRYYAKGSEQLYGVFGAWTGTEVVGNENIYLNGGAYDLLLPLTSGVADTVWSNTLAGYNSNYCVIAADAEHPEIIVRYMDYLLTEEESFQTLWGTFGELGEDHGDGTYTRWVDPDKDSWKTTVRVMPAYFSEDLISRTTIKNVATGVVSDKTGETKYQMALPYAEYAVKEFYPSPMLTSEENERISILSTPITNAMTEKEIAWILGQSDIESEYEAFLAELESMGLQEMLAIYQAAYDRVQ